MPAVVGGQRKQREPFLRESPDRTTTRATLSHTGEGGNHDREEVRT